MLELKQLIKRGCYSRRLGIDLNTEKGIFRWWLASLLFAKPIRAEQAERTYRLFVRYRIDSPQAILRVGWHRLVEVLDEGGYTRYDFSTADKLLEMARNLINGYGGSIRALKKSCRTQAELEQALKSLAKGIGDATVSIFLRDMQRVWAVRPKPTPLERVAMAHLGITDLRKYWRKNRIRGRSIADLQTALFEIGRALRKGAARAPSA